MKKANKRPADIFLMMLVICFSLHFLASFLLYELVSNTYFRKGFMNFTLLTYGPLIYLYARTIKGRLRAASTAWLVLAPGVIWSIPYLIILALWLAGSFSNYTYLLLYNRSLLIVAGPLNILCFLGARRIAGTFDTEESVVRNLIRTVSVTGVICVVLCVLLSFYIIAMDIPFGLFQQVVRSIGAIGVLISCLAIARYALVADRPRVFAIHSTVKTQRPTQLSPERLKEIYDQLMERVKEERLFLDPDLNMEKLTAATGYSRHQISEVLNQYADISFYSFINKFRVEQVCEQMRKAAAKTTMSSFNMLDLSYACGFKSKSTFNEYFRRFTDQTPSQYWGNLTLKEKTSRINLP